MPFEFEQYDSLNASCQWYMEAKRNAEAAEKILAEAKVELSMELERAGQKSHTFRDEQFTVVRTERLEFNEKGLKKALGAKVFNKLTVSKLDRKKLEDAVEAGEIDPVTVAQYTERKESEPFIRMTKRRTSS